MKGFTCKLKNVKSIEDWVKGETKEHCNSCLIGPLASTYLGVLEKAGNKSLAARLKKIFNDGDVLTICKELDIIKNEVGDSLRIELLDIDCFSQSEKF